MSRATLNRTLIASARVGEAKAAFQVEIEEQRRTVERLKETTWGVVLVCDPAGEHPLQKNPLLTMDRRPTVRLSSE